MLHAAESGREPGWLPRERPIVLLVEDDFDLREVLAERLGEAGFEVRTAGDGFEAVVAAALRPPDVVVTDLMMPNMSGPDLIADLRRRASLAPVPVIVITAAGHAPSYGLGCPVFVKPIRTDALVAAIRSLAIPRQ